MFDALKGIGCLLIVINHFHHKGSLGDIEYIISHIGVPLFFIISGYYMYNEDIAIIGGRMPFKIIHSVKLIVAHVTLYFAYFLYDLWVNQNFFMVNIYNEVTTIFSWERIKYILYVSGGLNGYAQWFLWSLLQAYIVFYIVAKLKLKIIFDKALFISIALLCFHIFGRLILYALGVKMLFGQPISETSTVRNVWFDAIPFMLLGYYYRTKTLKNRAYSFTYVVIIFGILPILFSLCEGLVLNKITDLNYVLYIGTVFSVLFLSRFAQRNPSLVVPCFTRIGRELSLIIYFIHPIVGMEISRYAKYFEINMERTFDFLYPIIVVIITVIIADILYQIKKSLDLLLFD